MRKKTLKLAIEAHLNRDIEKALILYKQAIEEGEDDPAAAANLGIIYREKGNQEEALQMSLKALQVDPNNYMFLANIGGIYLDKKSYKIALSYTDKSLSIHPNNPLALINKGEILRATGDFEKSLDSLQQAIKLDPSNPACYLSLGALLKDSGRYQSSIKAIEQCLALDKNNITALLSLCSIYLCIGDYKKAEINLNKARAARPARPEINYMMGKIKQSQGKLQEAKKFFTASLHLNCDKAASLYELSLDLKSTEEAEAILRTAQSTDLDLLSPPELSCINFSISNCHHKLRNFDKAMKFLKVANQEMRSHYPCDLKILEADTNYFLNRSEESSSSLKDSDGRKCIFIIGMPRCGSTLLENVLSVNSNIKGLGEIHAMPNALIKFDNLLEIKGEQPNLFNIYTEELGINIEESACIIDKQLFNFRFTGVISHHLPASKIIHCKRNPLDQILSIFRANFAAGSSYTNSLEETVHALAMHESAMLTYKKRYPKNIYTFYYDDFVSEPQKTLAPLVAWLGLDWDNNYLNHQECNNIVLTSSVIQVRNKINTKSLNSWKNYAPMLDNVKQAISNSGLFDEYSL